MKIYVVYSKIQDECTLNNKAFLTYEEASKYAQDVEHHSGCVMYPVAVELDGNICKCGGACGGSCECITTDNDVGC